MEKTVKKERIINVKREFNSMYYRSFHSSNYGLYLYENNLIQERIKSNSSNILIKNELKDNYNYSFFNAKNNDFNINCNEYQKILEKHHKQKVFLNYSYLVNKNSSVVDKEKNLMSVSYSANHSLKYYAEMQNLIDYYNYTNGVLRNYIPLFLTITLDGCYRDFLNGDFSRFDAERNHHEIPKDLRYKYSLKHSYSINDLVKVLNYQHKKMRDRYLNKYKDTKHDYIKVFEPHKNGVPHLHCLWFIPNDKDLINYLKKIFIECCPAPQNRSKKGLNTEQKKNEELQGFQISIKNSSAYIIKYIQKTFRDVKNNCKLSKINAWYIINKVRRFTRSNIITNNNQTFPLKIWRTLGGYFQDYLKEYEYFSDIEKGFYRPIKLSEFIQYFEYGFSCISYNFNTKKAPFFIDVVINNFRFFYTKKNLFITKLYRNKEHIIHKQKNNSYYVLPYSENHIRGII